MCVKNSFAQHIVLSEIKYPLNQGGDYDQMQTHSAYWKGTPRQRNMKIVCAYLCDYRDRNDYFISLLPAGVPSLAAYLEQGHHQVVW